MHRSYTIIARGITVYGCSIASINSYVPTVVDQVRSKLANSGLESSVVARIPSGADDGNTFAEYGGALLLLSRQDCLPSAPMRVNVLLSCPSIVTTGLLIATSKTGGPRPRLDPAQFSTAPVRAQRERPRQWYLMGAFAGRCSAVRLVVCRGVGSRGVVLQVFPRRNPQGAKERVSEDFELTFWMTTQKILRDSSVWIRSRTSSPACTAGRIEALNGLARCQSMGSARYSAPKATRQFDRNREADRTVPNPRDLVGDE